jgi:hypothetical protein
MNHYPNIVSEKANDFIEILKDIDFFEENEIEIDSSIVNLICEKLIKKFIDGLISESDEVFDYFSEDEINSLLTEIITLSALNSLKDKGIIDSIENEHNEEMFFLTEEGKKLASKIIK